MRIGYACINTTLGQASIQVNRSMIKKTFLEKGIAYASELALSNVTDLEKIVDWNIEHQLLLYRMSSDMFPWISEYEISQLPDFQKIQRKLEAVGEKVRRHHLRLTYHEGRYHARGQSKGNGCDPVYAREHSVFGRLSA